MVALSRRVEWLLILAAYCLSELADRINCWRIDRGSS